MITKKEYKMKRIELNENRLDKLNKIIPCLEKYLNEFKENISHYHELNKYYGSKEWFKDKDDYENGKIKNIKAGVLSEDAIWNLDENTRDLINRMDIIIKKINNIK